MYHFVQLHEFESWLITLYADLEGNAPLLEAIMGNHESVIKLLLDNGAEINSGNVVNYACAAVEQNNLELLKEIAEYGCDVTQPQRNGSTALHAAVCEGNNEIVRFLLDKGADIDKPDSNGWTPRALADHQGHEEIKDMFQNKDGIRKPKVSSPFPKIKRVGSKLAKHKSESSIPPYAHDVAVDNSHRRRACKYSNSLFGMMSNVNNGEHLFQFSIRSHLPRSDLNHFQVSVSCPQSLYVSILVVFFMFSSDHNLVLYHYGNFQAEILRARLKLNLCFEREVLR